jgi:hypothetical protein
MTHKATDRSVVNGGSVHCSFFPFTDLGDTFWYRQFGFMEVRRELSLPTGYGFPRCSQIARRLFLGHAQQKPAYVHAVLIWRQDAFYDIQVRFRNRISCG